MARLTGTIKRLMSDKGFGFVEAGEGNEFFFHQSACNGVQFDDLREGQAVTFDEGEGPKGPRKALASWRREKATSSSFTSPPVTVCSSTTSGKVKP